MIDVNLVKSHLSKDPIFKKIVDKIPLRVERLGKRDFYFELIRAIVFQQLSGKAASTIFGRFKGLFENEYPTAEVLIGLEYDTLRSVGLSNQKTKYVQNVANFFINEKLQNKDWSAMSDDAIVKYLTQIKGVGIWTVQMNLMFALNRPDVFPIGDLVVKNQVIKIYQLTQKGKALNKKIQEIAAAWKPYRSYASIYLWASKDS